MSEGLLLTAQERDRFASWLEREVESGKGMIQQLEKLQGMEPMIGLEKRRLAAYLIVAQVLRSTEEMTISK